MRVPDQNLFLCMLHGYVHLKQQLAVRYVSSLFVQQLCINSRGKIFISLNVKGLQMTVDSTAIRFYLESLATKSHCRTPICTYLLICPA